MKTAIIIMSPVIDSKTAREHTHPPAALLLSPRAPACRRRLSRWHGGHALGRGLKTGVVGHVRAHELIPKDDVLGEVGVWLPVVHLVRSHRVVDTG